MEEPFAGKHSRLHVRAFGLLIVGNEILDGRRTDAHFTDTRRQLHARRLALSYALILPDDPDVLTRQIAWAFSRNEPFFCCGGIGSTPDDLTRDCAARAAGVPVVRHPEGEKILIGHFGRDATPTRLRMVEFPVGSSLVPNPVNQVPGFHFRNGYFVPGFPEMAVPMRDWVLENEYEPGTERVARALALPGAREADLVDLMESFVVDHPALSFSSLPQLSGKGRCVILGISGAPEEVDRGLRDLAEALSRRRVIYEERPPS